MNAGEYALRIKPLVKVLTSQALYLETACGSGSVAATSAARPPDASEFAILQPNGATPAVRIDHNSIAFSGPVTPVAKVGLDLERAELLTLE